MLKIVRNGGGTPEKRTPVVEATAWEVTKDDNLKIFFQ